MLANPPTGVTNADLQGKRGEDWIDPVSAAKKNGALGVIFITPPPTLKNWEAIRRNSLEKGSLRMEKFIKPNIDSFPAIYASPRLVEAIFADEKVSSQDLLKFDFKALTDESLALKPEKKISISVADNLETVYTQNVAGIVEGSDPKPKNEYVAFGAHYDHVGINENAPGADKIWNGADDDGSGTVSILAMARALATAPTRPKRSALFVWHAGEEKGLWGAKYFSENPTVPLNQIITQLNIDMIGRSRAARIRRIKSWFRAAKFT